MGVETYEKNKELLARLANGDASVKEELIRANIGLVHSIANRYRPSPFYDDIMQEALIALSDAIDRYDGTRVNPQTGQSYRLSTFAGSYISGRILSFMRKHITPHEGVLSLDSPFGEDGELSDILGEEVDVSAGIQNSEALELINVNLNKVPKDEAEVIRLRYGIGYEQRHNFAEIGKRLHYTKEHARRIHELAIRRLRFMLQGAKRSE